MNLVLFLALIGMLELERWQGFIYNWVYTTNLLWITHPTTLVLLGIALTLSLRLKRPYNGYASIATITVALPPVDLWLAGVGTTYGFNLIYLFALTCLILVLGNRNEKLKTYFIHSGHAFFLLFLITGMASFFGRWDNDYSFLKTQHASLSFTYSPFVFLAAMEHSRTSAAGSTRIHRAASFVSLAALSGLFVSGFARISSGGESASYTTQTIIHTIFFALFLVLTIAHIIAAIPRIQKASSPAHSRKRYPLAGFVFLVITIASAPYFLSVFEVVESEKPVEPQSTSNQVTDEPRKSFGDLNIYSRHNSCSMAGCHIEVHGDAATQWVHSAHQQSANPFYTRVIDEPGGEEAHAALCSRCHEPLRQVVEDQNAGQIADSQEQGVSCGVCHFMKRDPAEPPLNGNYDLSVNERYLTKLRMPTTKTMVVYDSKSEHREETRAPGLGSSENCGVCHELVISGVHLRSTYSEWANGSYGPQGDGDHKGCVDCHMPNTPTEFNWAYPDRATHDHRLLGSNLMITGGQPALRKMKTSFLASAIALSFEPQPDDQNQITKLKIHLRNTGSGHGFPAAPLDLVDYWYEWKIGDAPWTRLHDSPLFHETLYDESGEVLDFHQLWRVKSRRASERIAPGASRIDVFELASPIAAANTETLEVRLMHRRLRLEMGKRVADQKDLFLDAVELVRSPQPKKEL